jgi:hypothetical protein
MTQDTRGSNALLSLAPENSQKTGYQADHFAETGPGSGTFLTLVPSRHVNRRWFWAEGGALRTC